MEFKPQVHEDSLYWLFTTYKQPRSIVLLYSHYIFVNLLLLFPTNF